MLYGLLGCGCVRSAQEAVDPLEFARRLKPAVLTQRVNNGRTGVNRHEYVLSPRTVTSGEFHRLFSVPVDGQIYAQPLFVPNVRYGDGTFRDVVIVTTAANSVYAFNSDHPENLTRVSLGSPVPANFMPMAYTTPMPVTHPCPWLAPSSAAPVGSKGTPYNLAPVIGSISTPVIDAKSMTLYVTAKVQTADGAIKYELHALDIVPELKERAGSPVEITGSVQHSNGTLTFDPRMHLQRTALLHQDGKLYIAFGSHQDTSPFHGWMFEYEAETLKRVRATALNPTTDGAGIWQAGNGPVGLAAGGVVVMSGNAGYRGCSVVGTIEHPTEETTKWQNSFVRFDPDGKVFAFRHPRSDSLDADDLDLGSSGPVLLPGTSLVAGAGKDGTLFIVDTTSMNAVGEFVVSNRQEGLSWFGMGRPHVHGTPVAWTTRRDVVRLFVWPEHSALTAIDVDVANPVAPLITVAQVGPMAPSGSMPGGLLALSTLEDTTANGLLWATIPIKDDAVTNNQVAGVLRVFRADDLNVELWNSEQSSAADQLGLFAKNASPVVAEGRVYVPTFDNQLQIYGLRQWASLLHVVDGASEISQPLGQNFAKRVIVENTGQRTWSTETSGDYFHVSFVDANSGAPVTTTDIPLSHPIAWSEIVQIDVDVVPPARAGNYIVRGQMVTLVGAAPGATPVSFGQPLDLGRLELR